MDVARVKYHSKINLLSIYKQVQIKPEDIWKTAFAIIYGTYISLVMQQGDCNTPAMFQCLMTVIFRDHIGHFIYIYLDDTFIFSNMFEEHELHLWTIVQILEEANFHLEQQKCDLYAKKAQLSRSHH